MRAILSFLILLGVALAGCSDGGSNEEIVEDAVNKDEFVLGANLGAIAGLLVDDRFRPIDLENAGDASGEFQAEGFVLLQETGERRLINENGEFSFVDLEPGTYTIRTSSNLHEATPQRVSVSAGEFAEMQILARRKATDNSAVVSTEYGAFVPCGFNIVVFGSSLDCTFDQSGDSDRVAFTVDYSEYTGATHLVAEMKANQKEFFDIWVQQPGNQVCSGAYHIDGGPDVDYIRMHFKIGEPHEESYATCGNLVWNNDAPMQTVVYLNSLGYEQGVGYGAGVYVGIQANFVHNLFIGEPQVNVDTFCAYCE